MTHPNPRLISLATALPPHRADQNEIKALVEPLFQPLARGEDRLLAIFDHSGVRTRFFCMPLDWLVQDHTFREKNDCYIQSALELTHRAAAEALHGAGLEPGDVDHVVWVSSTGVAAPSPEARLANLMGLREDVRRTPLWGLGCAGGVAGLARCLDFARADPSARVLLVAVELCSLTFQRGDLDRRNLVACSLFSDGAAAAVVAGPRARLPEARAPRLELLDSQSTLWPDTLDIMGWEIDGSGLHVVFSRDIPSLVGPRVRPSLEKFLRRNGLSLSPGPVLVAHPGGPKVLAAMEESLGLTPRARCHSASVLRECGNMSSPTCLFVLRRFLEAGDLAPSQPAVMMALGPGFAAEYVLLRQALS